MYIPDVHALFWGSLLHSNGKTLDNGIRSSSSLPEEEDEDIHVRETKTTLQVGTGCGVHAVRTYNMLFEMYILDVHM